MITNPKVTTRPFAEMPPVHSLAEIFPIDDGQPLDDLAKDIAAHGQQEPIVLLDGKILDGRRRGLACKKANVSPKTVDFEEISNGMSPEAFVWSKNIHRRHLTESQRAMAVAELETYTHGGPRKGQDANLHLDRATRAREAGVSPRSVANANRVRKKGDPELIQAVRSGDVFASDAAQIVDEPGHVQKAAVAAKREGQAKTVRAAVKGPKNGQEPFDDNLIDKAIAKLNRLLDDRNNSRPSQLIAECREHLERFDESWRKAKAEVRS
jgi:ParB-like chromosome segregation protein Spo0J